MKSISNAKMTLLRKLNRKKFREKEQLFLIEGERAVEQAINNGRLELQELFFDESQQLWQQAPWMEAVGNYPSSLLNQEHFQEVSDTENPQGLLALCKIPAEADVEDLISRQGIIVASDGIQDPGNLGTIIRTAVWFGAAGFLSGKGTVDLFHPKVVRSTAGATGALSYRDTDLRQLLPKFEEGGWQVLVLDGGKEAEDIRKIDPSPKTIIVVGNEAHGVDKALFTDQRKSVSILSKPKEGEAFVESLNAAIATGIALYAMS